MSGMYINVEKLKKFFSQTEGVSEDSFDPILDICANRGKNID